MWQQLTVQPKSEFRAPPFNEAALAAMGLSVPFTGDAGRTVVIGFVDYGFDLLHPCLLDQSSKVSRFAYLWDQNVTPDAARTSGLDVSQVADWDAKRLNGYIAEAQASGSRRALDALYDPHANNCGRHGTQGGAHGSMMASIAAGTPFAGFRGAAPAAILIGVQLALLDCDWKEEDARGRPTWLDWRAEEHPVWDGWRAYDEAAQIVNAVRYVYDRACRLGADAVVINLSIGAWAGAHDGQSPVERGIADLILVADDRAAHGCGPLTTVVVGSGNAGVDEGHFSGCVTAASPVFFEWRKNSENPAQNKLEIWYQNNSSIEAPLDVRIATPGPSNVSIAIVPGRTCEIVVRGVRVGIADHVPKVRGDLGRVRVLLYAPLFPEALFETGDDRTSRWGITAAVPAGTVPPPMQLHAWVERDDGIAERSTLMPSHPETTLCCLATVQGALVVAGYDHHQDICGVMPVSSLGPGAWTACQIPHVAAPGHRIWGARSKSRGFAETTGTSAAVALTSGVLAAALQKNDSTSVKKVLQWLKSSNTMFNSHIVYRKTSNIPKKWNARSGFGVVSV